MDSAPSLDQTRDGADARLAEAAAIMRRFAERTGLEEGTRPQRRYLWTDAFAVCNWLGLARVTGDHSHRERALTLIDQVHRTLGRHRGDDGRNGWLSGPGDRQAQQHPTAGGLRIGKPLPERAPGEQVDPRLEWEQDGQYFHYLTRWMHALDIAARTTRQRQFCSWARELAEAAHDAFVYRAPGSGGPRMYWKMSIDLSRPLVASMGQHDPLDGLVTLVQIQSTARALGDHAGAEALADHIASFGSMVDLRQLVTDDPLGIGGLLIDASRLHQLTAVGAVPGSDHMVGALLTAAVTGLRHHVATGDQTAPAHARLPFRELGLAIGLAGARRMVDGAARAAGAPGPAVTAALGQLHRFLPIAEAIESFWLDSAHQRAATFTDHIDINEVMLATSLAPAGYLSIPPP